jgi:hypothetical protein
MFEATLEMDCLLWLQHGHVNGINEPTIHTVHCT